MNAFVLYLIVLRIVHIVAGVLWVGSAVFYFAFVEPTIRSIGPAGPQFMQELIGKRRYPLFMNVASALTLLAGALLYWTASGGLQVAWLKTGPGLGFTIGSVVAMIVYAIGFLLIRPRAGRLGELGQAIHAAGGPPSAAQAAELYTLNESLSKIHRIDVILLTISLLMMATARYWSF